LHFKQFDDSYHKHIEKYYNEKTKSNIVDVDLDNVITVTAKVADESIHCKPDLKGEEHQHFYIDLD
jgi:hypothetical protein